MNYLRTARILLAASSLTVLAGACGSSAKKAASTTTIALSTGVSTTAIAPSTVKPGTTTAAPNTGNPGGPANPIIPAGFPTDLPLPALPFVKFITGEGFTLRFTSTNATKDIATYEKLLAKAGYSKTGEVDALDGQQHSFTSTARKGGTHIEASAYGPDAAEGGNYLDLIVTIGG
jgi:hypothetical protein